MSLILLADKIDALNERIGSIVSWLMLGMMLVVLAVIFFSFFFRWGWAWLSELALYMHAFLFTSGAAYVLCNDAHVRLDVFYSRFSLKNRARVNLFGTLFLLFPVCVVILYSSVPYVISSWEVLERSPERQGLPAVFLLKTMMLLMPVLLILQGSSIIIKSWAVIRNKQTKEG